jgi:hypothetical protein
MTSHLPRLSRCVHEQVASLIAVEVLIPVVDPTLVVTVIPFIFTEIVFNPNSIVLPSFVVVLYHAVVLGFDVVLSAVVVLAWSNHSISSTGLDKSIQTGSK